MIMKMQKKKKKIRKSLVTKAIFSYEVLYFTQSPSKLQNCNGEKLMQSSVKTFQ